MSGGICSPAGLRFAGGDSLAKLRAIETARVGDVRRLAPDAPSSLSAAVMACLRREPSLRPESMARLAATLGTSTHSGRHLLAECLRHPARRPARWSTSISSLRDSGHAPLWLAATAGCLVAAITLTWSMWPMAPPIPPAAISAGPADGRSTSVVQPSRLLGQAGRLHHRCFWTGASHRSAGQPARRGYQRSDPAEQSAASAGVADVAGGAMRTRGRSAASVAVGPGRRVDRAGGEDPFSESRFCLVWPRTSS